MNIISKYKNGNYHVMLFEDGTKVRFNNKDSLIPAFAENIDITITKKCDGNCSFCYMNCNEYGDHADLTLPFFDTFHKGQEIAINGNDLSHPDLIYFLQRMKDKGIIVNITINQKHFLLKRDYIDFIARKNLVKGIGVSLSNVDELIDNLDYVKHFSNLVIHTIDGLLSQKDLEILADKGLKLLILGYKKIGRGKDYYSNTFYFIEKNKQFLKENILQYRNRFDIISFDNLALEHLDIKNQISKKEWEECYMGDEGTFTFYIDAVDKTFALSSLEEKEIYKLLDNVDDMFKIINN